MCNVFLYMSSVSHKRKFWESSLKCFKILRLKLDVEAMPKTQNLSFQKFLRSILQISINVSLQLVISVCLSHKYSPELNDCTQQNEHEDSARLENVSINLALERSAFVNLVGSCLLEKRICRSSALSLLPANYISAPSFRRNELSVNLPRCSSVSENSVVKCVIGCKTSPGSEHCNDCWLTQTWLQSPRKENEAWTVIGIPEYG